MSLTRPALTALALCATLPNVALAFADDAAEEIRLETVQVTDYFLANEKFSGTKTLTPVIDVPQSLSIVDATKIIEQGFTNVGDILRYTPGASTGQGEGHRDQISLRGQNTTADFFLDGLRDDVQYFRPLYNLQQIEILRGANAMIFGRGGGGGIVNRVTKTPDLNKDLRAVMVSVDTFGELSTSLDYNAAFSDAAAFRINAFAESLDNHRDEFGGDRFAINPTLLFKPSSDTAVKLFYEYVSDDRVVDRGVPSENGVPVEDFDTTFFGSPTENFTTIEAHIAKARLDHSFSDSISANATLQYADYDKAYQNLFPTGIDTAANTVNLGAYKDTTDRQNLILQTNLIANLETGPIGHTVLVGAEYADQQTDNARFNATFETAPTGLEITSPLAISPFAFDLPVRDRGSEVQVLSIYLQDQIDIGDHLKLIGGVRFDQFEIDVDDRGGAAQFSRTDEEVSPRLGLIYKPAENVSAYLSYSKSFLPQSGDQFLSLSSATEDLRPESFENTEIGLKWDLRSDLSLTTAYFQLDRDTALATPDALDRFRAITETSGFEIQLDGQLTDNWALQASYSNLDSVIIGGNADGNETGQVPEHMLSLWNRFDVTDQLGFGLGIIYQDEQFVRSDNSVTIPDFTRVDASAYYTMDNGARLQVGLENLLDEDYFPDAHSNSNISTGAPFNARFTIRTAF